MPSALEKGTNEQEKGNKKQRNRIPGGEWRVHKLYDLLI
jgi:hypothetical protein